MDKQAKATNWSVTINNPTKNDDEYIALARQKGWKVEGQLEKGENGTPHFQLLVICKGQQRFSAIKKAFPRAHIEIARDMIALRKYVNKEDTRVGQLPTQSEHYPSCSKLMSWFGEAFDNYKPLGEGIDDSELLIIFDKMINQKIREGFYVEGMAVNPQIRSSIKSYGRSIAFRERLHRQKTDRQTIENIISPSVINSEDAEITQEITIPEIESESAYDNEESESDGDETSQS